MIDMNKKSTYSSPELELIKYSLSADVLSVSDPAEPVTPGPGGGVGPGVDPCGDLTP